jgi:hypothetical protein
MTKEEKLLRQSSYLISRNIAVMEKKDIFEIDRYIYIFFKFKLSEIITFSPLKQGPRKSKFRPK